MATPNDRKLLPSSFVIVMILILGFRTNFVEGRATVMTSSPAEKVKTETVTPAKGTHDLYIIRHSGSGLGITGSTRAGHFETTSPVTPTTSAKHSENDNVISTMNLATITSDNDADDEGQRARRWNGCGYKGIISCKGRK